MSHLKQYIVWLRLPVESATAKTIEAYIDCLLNNKIGAKTINCHLVTIRGFYEFLQQHQGLAIQNPVRANCWLRLSRPLPKHLTDAHVAGCPHVDARTLETAQAELDHQHAAGKWTKRDMAEDALEWARGRAASVNFLEAGERIGAVRVKTDAGDALELPYFGSTVRIRQDGIDIGDGQRLNRWEQVFLYNHLAQGGRREPTGNWKGFQEFPNTVSKIKSMKTHVEAPLVEHLDVESILFLSERLRQLLCESEP